MRKISTTFLILAAFSLGLMAQQPTQVIKKASVAPVIGGEIDAVWDEATPVNIDQPHGTEVPTLGESGETTWQMLWNEDGMYLLLRVTDDAFYPHYAPDPAGNSWEHDKPEVYFDCNFTLADGGGAGSSPGHHQFAPAFEDGSNDGTAITEDNGVVHAFVVSDPNYTAEYFVPFSALTDKDGGIVAQDANIGFDVTIIDREAGDDGRRRAVWANTGANGESWNNMDDVGIITLEGAEAKVYIDAITITGGDIDMNNGTVEMQYTIAPEDATSQMLAWSVEDGTGRAKISTDGVVTGVVDGTVTVKGETTDGSFLEETVTINISNQIVVMDEINYVRNGNFHDLDENAAPLQWTGGNSSDGDGYVTDGYMVLDPAPGGSNPWDFTFVQSGFGLNTTDMFTFSFVAWADADRLFNVDFEDPANGYNRFGTSTHEYSNGESDWTFTVTTEPTKYVFDVVFDELLENTSENLQFMLGVSDTVVYLDSVSLINELDLDLLTVYTPVGSVEVTSADDVTFIEEGSTVQMSAAVLPADADYPDIVWSVVNQTGYATIDENGMVSGDTVGLVTVVASTIDDSNVSGSFDLEVRVASSISNETAQSLKVYPNPAVNELNIVVGKNETTVSIYNSVGARMKAFTADKDVVTVDISNYPSGVYFVRTGNLVAKFVK